MTRYELPAPGKCHEETSKSPEFKPTPRQQLLLAAAERAIDAGHFYNVDVNAAVAADLGVTREQLVSNTHKIESGDFCFDVYFARGAVEAIRYQQKLVDTAAALALKTRDTI